MTQVVLAGKSKQSKIMKTYYLFGLLIKFWFEKN